MLLYIMPARPLQNSDAACAWASAGAAVLEAILLGSAPSAAVEAVAAALEQNAQGGTGAAQTWAAAAAAGGPGAGVTAAAEHASQSPQVAHELSGEVAKELRKVGLFAL